MNLRRKVPLYIIKSQIRFTFSLSIILLGTVFIIGGIESEGLANVFQQYYKIQKDYVPNDNIQFEDIDPHIYGITDFRIYKTDDHPLEIGQPLRLQVYLNTMEMPKELVVLVFHQNMVPFFTGNSSSDYRGIAAEFGRVLALRYGDVYNVQFDLNIPKNVDHYDLNGNSTMIFTTPGTYMAQISEKTSNGHIEHYMSPFAVTTIRDSREDWTVQAIQNLIHVAEDQKSSSIRAFGMSYLGIGIGMVLSGFSFMSSAVEKNKRERDKKINEAVISDKEQDHEESTSIFDQSFKLEAGFGQHAIISRKYGKLILTNFGLTVWFALGAIVVGIIFSFMWNDFDTNLTKLGSISAVSGIFLATYMALWIMNRDRIKSIEENAVYKVSLLHDLSSLTHAIIQPLLSQKIKRKKDPEEIITPKLNEQKLFEAHIEEFKYWASRIQAINSNTYVPPLVRDTVSMLLHQGIKPIVYPDFSLSKDFVNDTFLRFLDKIIFSEYISLDKDPSVRNFLNNVKTARKLLLKLFENENESTEENI
jgi:hypothetical protein